MDKPFRVKGNPLYPYRRICQNCGSDTENNYCDECKLIPFELMTVQEIVGLVTENNEMAELYLQRYYYEVWKDIAWHRAKHSRACIDCGFVFYKKSGNHRRCKWCARLANKEQVKARTAKYKRPSNAASRLPFIRPSEKL